MAVSDWTEPSCSIGKHKVFSPKCFRICWSQNFQASAGPLNSSTAIMYGVNRSSVGQREAKCCLVQFLDDA